MDIFEYNEVRWPTRALQQEEEEEAVPGAESTLLPPDTKWSNSGTGHVKPQLLVVAMSPASCALLVAALGPSPQEVGQVVLPPLPSAQPGDKPDTPAALYSPQPGVLVCCCSTAVAPERAGAWARGVISELQPQRMLLLGSMQVEQYRGEADPSQELVAFVLRSTPMRQQLEQQPAAAPPGPKVPYLPSGSIVSGLTAALITQAELRALPAELLVVVEQVPSLVPETLGYLGKLLVGSLQQVLGSGGQAGSGGEQQWGAALLEGGVVDAARLKLQRTAYRPTSVYS